MNEQARYEIKAKRKGTKEPWTEWTRAENYSQAEKHAAHVEELGYSAKVVVREKQIKELWDILGSLGGVCGVTEQADAIFDAGYRKQNEVAREIFEEIERALAMHFCSCLPCGDTNHYDYYEGDLANAIAELKKKYTEEKENEN